ncbi:MAG TPA: hypothetical protein DCM05_09400 [Elusimicrobia bacterium]|nr:hypothetical protein [Elusimicrobiota bacterium]
MRHSSIVLGALLLAAPTFAEGPESLRAGADLSYQAVRFRLPSFRARPSSAQQPSWLVVEGAGPGFEQGKAQLLAALHLVGRTSDGPRLAEPLLEKGARIVVRESGMWVVDSDNEFTAGLDFMQGRRPETLAPLVAHELEHLVQRGRGLTGEGARGARELGAFLVQCRPWAELGAPVEESDWASNRSNSQDMWAWVDYPASAMAALALRGGLELDFSRKDVRAYWEGVLAEEARWRATREPPKGRDSRSAALFILEQAASFSDRTLSGKVSAWLPDALETAFREGPGALPGEPTEKDRALLRALSGPSAPSPSR